MKKIVLFALYLISLSSFAQTKRAHYLTKTIDNAVIYEANIRQYSKSGTFNAFTKDIPTIKKLGVKILWVMPIYPIGIENRKEGLGSYYSIKDYKAINPEYGNLTDFTNLVNVAHANGMLVILDWVANHTAWDHAWVKKNPDFYAKDKTGKMLSPFDWTDVVKLDYSNQEMRKTMISEMNYWLKTANIDGFRCDVAMEVPKDFWDEATTQLNKSKKIFMLMEAEQPDLMQNAFDMQYGWEAHHIMNDIAQGKKTVANWNSYIQNRGIKFATDDITMNFTSNHDENSWNGTEYERLGDAVEPFAALTFMTTGMPLIYNGQEYDFNHRLKFFVKDEITPKTKTKMFSVYEKLGKLKNTNPALNGGKNPASYNKINNSSEDNILAFDREKDGNKIIYLGNLTKNNQTFTTAVDGNYLDYMTNQKISLKNGQIIEFKPWEYKILIKQ
jgi:alpha-amylase